MDYSNIEGAYVNVLIDFPNQQGAEVLARFYINDAGWLDKELTQEPGWFDFSDFDNLDAEDERYEDYEKAFKYGFALRFHTFLKEN